MNVPRPSAISFPVPNETKVRFAIEYSGSLSNVSRLRNFNNFETRDKPRRVSFIVANKTSFFEPTGILKKEIRSNDPQVDKFLSYFKSDNKNAKIEKLYFFREIGTDIISNLDKKIDKKISKIEQTSDNLILLGLLVLGAGIVIFSNKKQKR